MKILLSFFVFSYPHTIARHCANKFSFKQNKKFLSSRVGLAILLICSFHSSTAYAELLGLVSGRSARLPPKFNLSVEAGYSWYTQQLQWSTARINVKPTNGFLSYFDIAKLTASELPISPTSNANFSGYGFGGGMVVVLPESFNKFDLALKVAYHTALIDQSADNASMDTQAGTSKIALKQSQWSSEIVFSPIDPVFKNGLTWYATAGYVVTVAKLEFGASVNAQSSGASEQFLNYEPISGLVFGAGVVKPTGRTHFFAGASYLAGDPFFSFGVRYNIR